MLSMDLFSLLLMLPQDAAADGGFVNSLVRYFNQGGGFMWPVLIVMILGLAISFERIITLNRADINTRKFIVRVKKALEEGGVSAAEEVCANTRGPVASVFQAGLLRADDGIEAVEKAVVSYGSIEMSFLERGLVWLSLFIVTAPMFGFLGTVNIGAVTNIGDVRLPRDGVGDGRGLRRHRCCRRHLADARCRRYHDRPSDHGLRSCRGYHASVLLQLRRRENRPHRG